MPHRSYREESKTNWGTSSSDNLNIEQINCGAILRIADATEKMAGNYIALQNDRDLYKRWHGENQLKIQKLERSNASLRGHVKRLKNKNNEISIS